MECASAARANCTLVTSKLLPQRMQDVAERIGREARLLGFAPCVLSMDAYPLHQLPTERFAVFVTSTTGQVRAGQPTAQLQHTTGEHIWIGRFPPNEQCAATAPIRPYCHRVKHPTTCVASGAPFCARACHPARWQASPMLSLASVTLAMCSTTCDITLPALSLLCASPSSSPPIQLGPVARHSSNNPRCFTGGC